MNTNKHFFIEGVNSESHGFDHRLCEWQGVIKTGANSYKRVTLIGEEALLAYADAQENGGVRIAEEAVSCAAVAPVPNALPVAAKKKEEPKKAQEQVTEEWQKPWETDEYKAKKSKTEKKEPEDGKADVDPITGDSDKPVIADEKSDTAEMSCDESANTKRSALRRPKMAGPRGPHLGESIESIVADMLTDDPDIFN